VFNIHGAFNAGKAQNNDNPCPFQDLVDFLQSILLLKFRKDYESQSFNLKGMVTFSLLGHTALASLSWPWSLHCPSAFMTVKELSK